MTLSEVIRYFGTPAAVMRSIGIARPNWYYWEKKNAIPYERQIDLEKASKRKLKAKWRHSTEYVSVQKARRERCK